MNRKISKSLSFATLLTMLVGVAGCMEEKNDPGVVNPGDSKSLQFQVGGASQLDTKAGTHSSSRSRQVAKIALSEPNDPDQIYLICEEQSLDDYYFRNGKETKGAPVYTETFKFKNISTVPYTTEGSLFTDVKSYYSGCLQESTLTYAFDFNDPGWPDGVTDMRFFFGAPVTIDGTGAAAYDKDNTDHGCYGVTLNASANTISFYYKSPAAAADQTDILFTSKKVNRANYIANTPEYILFYHALAGVKFKSANAEREAKAATAGNTMKVTTAIKSVKLYNVVSEGSCILTPQADGYTANDSNAATDTSANTGSVPKSKSCNNWTLGTATSEFMITEEGTVNNEIYPETTGFEGANSSQLGQYNINKSDFSDTFFFIPQTTGTDTELEIVYTLSTDPTTEITKKVKLPGQVWDAGYIYTYTLSANHVDVAIADNVVDSGDKVDRIKKDLTIKNTGNVDAYMRVAVVGNWFDNEGNIVAPWKLGSSEGRLIPVEGSDDYQTYNADCWQLKDDGYYYYKYIVRPGDTILNPLFYSYEVWDSPHDYFFKDRAHLEMDILVQSFDAAKLANMASNWVTEFFSTEYDHVINK